MVLTSSLTGHCKAVWFLVYLETPISETASMDGAKSD